VPAFCAASPLAVSTVREFIGTSQHFSLVSVSFISMLHTPLFPVIQMTEYKLEATVEEDCDTIMHFIMPNH
jgi:hypothetical protein